MGQLRSGPRPADLDFVRQALAARGGAAIPHNFAVTAPPYDPAAGQRKGRMPQRHERNPQVRVCVCVRVRVCVCVCCQNLYAFRRACMCVLEITRERTNECVCGCVRKTKRICVRDHKERTNEYVCVCWELGIGSSFRNPVRG